MLRCNGKMSKRHVISVVPQFETSYRRTAARSCGILQFMAKRPRDPVQLAKQVFDIAIGEAKDTVSESKRHPQTTKGRAGGLKGGKARAKHLTPEQRRRIARGAAQARWKKI